MCNVAIRPKSRGENVVCLSSSNRNIQDFFCLFVCSGHFLNPLVSVRTIKKKKKTSNRDKIDNNIVTPSFYKNIIFTSLSKTSLLSLYTVQGNNKRNEGVCLRHTTLAIKASIKQRKIKWCFCPVWDVSFDHVRVLSPYLWVLFIFLGEMCRTFILPCWNLGQKCEQESEEEVQEAGLEYLHQVWQVQSETKLVREVFDLKGFRCNTGEVKQTENTALWHMNSVFLYQTVTACPEKGPQSLTF